jgi:hypothetical protein
MEVCEGLQKAPDGAFFSHSDNNRCAVEKFLKKLNYFLTHQMSQKLLADQVLSA